MHVITRKEMAKSAGDRFWRQYKDYWKEGAHLDCFDIYREFYESLEDTKDIEAHVTNSLGPSWVQLECAVCQTTEPELMVELLEGDDERSFTICQDCLQQAQDEISG